MPLPFERKGGNEFRLGSVPESCLITLLSVWGVGAARWQEGGEAERSRRNMLGLPCLPEADSH